MKVMAEYPIIGLKAQLIGNLSKSRQNSNTKVEGVTYSEGMLYVEFHNFWTSIGIKLDRKPDSDRLKKSGICSSL